MVFKRFLVLLCFALFLVDSVFCMVYPILVNATGTTDIRGTGAIQIFYDNTTEHTFQIYNVTIQGITGFNFSQINQLNYNETRNLNYSFLFGTPQNTVIPSKITYYYLTEGTRQENITPININNTMVYRPNTTIYYNDTIVMYNRDSINHSIRRSSDSSVFVIGSQGNKSIRYQELGEIEYLDQTLSQFFYINIKQNNITLQTHSPNYDKNISFFVYINYQNTNYSLQTIPNSFSMPHNEKRTGVLRLESASALHNVVLSGEWLNFSENGFSFSGDKLVTFNVTPKITATSDTNKTHTKTIYVTTANGGNKEIQVPVFINYYDFGGGSSNVSIVLVPMTAEQMIAYCDKINWTYPCQVKNVTIMEYVPRVLYPSINESDAYEVLQAGKRAEEGVIRVLNKLDEYSVKVGNLELVISDINMEIESLRENTTSQIELIAKDVAERRQDTSNFMWEVMLLLIFAGIGVSVYYIIKIVKSRKQRMDLRL